MSESARWLRTSPGAGSRGARCATTSAPPCRQLFTTPSPARSWPRGWSGASRLDAVHARSHVPAASALILRRLTGCRLIFDLRGLWADEYADAGRWRRDGVAYRITAWIQRMALERADGVVMLTDRVRKHLFGENAPERAVVIPCCVDLDRVQENPEASERLRERLGLTGRPVIVYVGKLTAPYMDREMVEFFAARPARQSQACVPGRDAGAARDHRWPSSTGRGSPQTDYRITSCQAERSRRLPGPRRLRDLLLPADVRADRLVSDQDR